MMFNREELIAAAGAQCLKDDSNAGSGYSISTDTRTIQKGDVYLPLKGANFDGEKFIDKALETGAAGYFTSVGKIYDNADIILKVSDTKEAYLNLAKFYRHKVNPVTVMITGSSGKTTTKEMIYSVMSQKFRTQKTFSNHNNEIGFCQTVLGMKPDTQCLIVEAGMRGLGEIELISKHLEPDFAVITNCGTAHVGRLGSLDNIAAAKCEIASGLSKTGALVALNQDITKRHLKYDGKKIFYSSDDVKIIRQAISYSKFEYKGHIYELNTEGGYNIENSLAAIELGLLNGISEKDIAKGLYEYKPIEKRWETVTADGISFINDSYNANPESVKASVKTFVELYDNPVVILGNMGELGENEVLYHRETGKYLAGLKKNVKYIVVGDLAAETGKVLETGGFSVKYFKNTDEAALYLKSSYQKGETVFLKASRSMEFEKIIENIKRGITQ